MSWDWIVDEGRQEQRYASWKDPAEYIDTVQVAYRKDFWAQQPYDVRVWSEKSTVEGVLKPVLDQWGVPFQFHRGFSSTTSVHNAAVSNAVHESIYPSILLYIGDFDPSGYYMSAADLPERLVRNGSDAEIHRIALRPEDGPALDLPWFPLADKAKDNRYAWWRKRGLGERCWELDALDPNMLRHVVSEAIAHYVDMDAWHRCEQTEAAERRSMTEFFAAYPGR